MMCRLYGVTRAGFYAWRSRERSARERQDEALTAEIRARVASLRYTSPSIQRFFGAIANESLELPLEAPDQVWVGDITCLKVGATYRYLAVVMDKSQPPGRRPELRPAQGRGADAASAQ